MVFKWIGRKREEPRKEPVFIGLVEWTYRVGDVIGGEWRVLRAMEGGLGVVYAVEHREGGRCVLKAPKRQSDPEVRKSFRTEAETWVRLGDHPNIVPARGVEEFAGQLFVVAQLVESDDLNRVSLRDYLSAGPLQLNAVATWTADFCHGLDYAVSKGLVAHRDIKPDNLLIGASGILRITDFGIAKAMVLSSPGGSSSAPLHLGFWPTSGGNVAGTPPYMAPEQWLGANQDVRTDIYAFGVVMHEMCYGVRPFAATDLPTLAHQHLRIVPQVPHGVFAEIIARCLAKDPAERFATPVDFLVEFSKVCTQERLGLPLKPPTIDQAQCELDARAHGLGSLGKYPEAIAAARQLVALQPLQSRNWTQLGRLLAESQDYEGAATALLHSVALDETRSPAWNNLGVILKRLQRWQHAVSAFDRALDCDPFNTAAMLNSAEPLQRLGRVGDAIARLERAAAIAPDKYSVWINLGAMYVDVGEKQKALDCFHQARGLAPVAAHAHIDEAIRLAEAMSDV